MMKAECKVRCDGYRVCKPAPMEDGAEMKACFHKLKQLVPTVDSNRKLSKVQLLQHVIDYILDLEVELETSPLSGLTSHLSNTNFLTRLPLSEKMEQDTSSTDTTLLWHSEDISLLDCETTRTSPK